MCATKVQCRPIIMGGLTWQESFRRFCFGSLTGWMWIRLVIYLRTVIKRNIRQGVTNGHISPMTNGKDTTRRIHCQVSKTEFQKNRNIWSCIERPEVVLSIIITESKLSVKWWTSMETSHHGSTVPTIPDGSTTLLCPKLFWMTSFPSRGRASSWGAGGFTFSTAMLLALFHYCYYTYSIDRCLA